MLTRNSLQALCGALLSVIVISAPACAQQRGDGFVAERGVRAGFDRAGGAPAGDRAAFGAQRTRINPAKDSATGDSAGDGRFGGTEGAAGGRSARGIDADGVRYSVNAKPGASKRVRREGDCLRPRAGRERFKGGAGSQQVRCDSQPGY